MHRLLLAVVVLAGAAACGPDHSGTATGPGVPSYAFDPDLVGTPDLIVDQHRLAASWVIYEEEFSASACSVQEGGFEPGVHRTLRFTVMTPNLGDADVFIGNPLDHVAANDGLFEFASCHNHFHFRNYAKYEILPVRADGSLGAPIQAKKHGFCMIDTDPWEANVPPTSFVYRSCGTQTRAGNQGISTGWADTYFKWLAGQFFLLTDPREPIPPGEYLIRITANPPFTPVGGEPCPHLDGLGFCHMLRESNYGNNVAEVRVTVPDRVGKQGFGPGGGIEPPPHELIDDENRHGAG